MKIDTIKKHLKGYFINRINHNGMKVTEKLCKKIDGNDYEVLDNVNTPNGLVSAYTNCLNQVNANILDPSVSICNLSEILPVIQGDIFEKYKVRQKEINQHRTWQECYKTEKNHYVEDTYLVKWQRPRGIVYGIVGNNAIEEISDVILTDKQKENAVNIKFPNMLLSAIKDNLINEFEEEYLKEVAKYESL